MTVSSAGAVDIIFEICRKIIILFSFRFHLFYFHYSYKRSEFYKEINQS